MGLFSKIFKKKPGGSLLGNLVRGVSSNLTGGVLGQGGNKIEVGQTLTNNQLAEQAAAAANQPAPNPVMSQLSDNFIAGLASTPQVKEAAGNALLTKMKENWVAIVAVLVAGYFIAKEYIFKPKKGGKGKTF